MTEFERRVASLVCSEPQPPQTRHARQEKQPAIGESWHRCRDACRTVGIGSSGRGVDKDLSHSIENALVWHIVITFGLRFVREWPAEELKGERFQSFAEKPVEQAQLPQPVSIADDILSAVVDGVLQKCEVEGNDREEV